MSAGDKSRELRSCPHCGELAHPTYMCRPEIQTMLAEEKLAHDAEHAELFRLRAENERLRREVEER